MPDERNQHSSPSEAWEKTTEVVEYPPGKPVEFRRKDGTLIAVVQIGRSHSLTTTLRKRPT